MVSDQVGSYRSFGTYIKTGDLRIMAAVQICIHNMVYNEICIDWMKPMYTVIIYI